jgi:hypothetical protein
MDQMELAKFWEIKKKEGVLDYSKVATESLGIKVVPLPQEHDLGRQILMPLRCPKHLRDHFTVTIKMDDVYYSATPVRVQQQETTDSDAEPDDLIAQAVLKKGEDLKINLYNVTRNLSLIKSEKFT